MVVGMGRGVGDMDSILDREVFTSRRVEDSSKVVLRLNILQEISSMLEGKVEVVVDGLHSKVVVVVDGLHSKVVEGKEVHIQDKLPR
jgi:uncharacterized protein (UPF0216 family)